MKIQWPEFIRRFFNWLLRNRKSQQQTTLILMETDHTLLREDAVAFAATLFDDLEPELLTGLVMQNPGVYQGGTLHALMTPRKPFEVRIGYRDQGKLYIAYYACEPVPVGLIKHVSCWVQGGTVILTINMQEQYPPFAVEQFDGGDQSLATALESAICVTYADLPAWRARQKQNG